ncbi:MAG: endo-1,4-beta-xylanase [Oscillospiraceae bacterium]|jgi:GH35 family endo-1,4-beta-xylanase|nr:endo-1,4-beta-xylanase [Oscillospiraceae bacterium]
MTKQKPALRVAAILLAIALTTVSLPLASASDGMAKSLQLPSLHEIYKGHFLVGNIFSGSSDYTKSNVADRRFDLLKRHFNVLTGENAMKPQYMSTSKGSYSFGTADKMIETVSGAGIDVIGHTLVWHSQSAVWLNQGATRAQAKANLEDYINTVAKHFAGKLTSWDVVNEAFETGVNSVPANWRDALRKGGNTYEHSRWYEAYENGADKAKGESGADYIYDAFVFARLADPGAILYYNDFNEEYSGKREAIARMTEELNAQWKTDSRNTEPGRLLIEGLGMQSHFWTSALNVNNVEATIKRFAQTGAIISVTELDIPAGRWDGYIALTEEEEKKQARLYAQLFQLYQKYSEHIERVTFWGLEDTASWRRQGNPLLFDGSFNAKHAFYAVADPDGYLAGRYNDPKTRDALLQEALGPSKPEPEPEPEPSAEVPNLTTADGWAHDHIQQAYSKGFLPATLQNNYKADITRGEFVTLALSWLRTHTKMTNAELLAKHGKPEHADRTFTDTSDDDVLTAARLDITAGTTPGVFGVNTRFDREQAAIMLMKICRIVGTFKEDTSDFGFTDIDAAQWLPDALNYVGHSEVMSGKLGGRFAPKDNFQRQESIIVFNKMG